MFNYQMQNALQDTSRKNIAILNQLTVQYT